MRELRSTKQFKKDSNKLKKQGKDLDKLKEVIGQLQRDEPLPERCRDHLLQGDWKPCRDCHIEPDWLLIYDISEPGLLILTRTGSHSDLFK